MLLSMCPAVTGQPGTITTGTWGNRCCSLSVSNGRRPTSSWQPSPCRLTSATSNVTSTLGSTLNQKPTSPRGWVCPASTVCGLNPHMWNLSEKKRWFKMTDRHSCTSLFTPQPIWLFAVLQHPVTSCINVEASVANVKLIALRILLWRSCFFHISSYIPFCLVLELKLTVLFIIERLAGYFLINQWVDLSIRLTDISSKISDIFNPQWFHLYLRIFFIWILMWIKMWLLRCRGTKSL